MRKKFPHIIGRDRPDISDLPAAETFEDMVRHHFNIGIHLHGTPSRLPPELAGFYPITGAGPR
jgi:hypothetical protein